MIKFTAMKKNRIQSSLFLFFASVCIVLLTGCIDSITCEKGNGTIIKQDRKITSFNKLEVSGAYTIVLKQDSVASVYVEADENLQTFITTKVEKNKLVIENKKSVCGSKDLIVYITTPELKSIDISGAVELNTTNNFKADDLGLYLSGAAEMQMNVSLNKLKLVCSGSGKLSLKGKSDEVDALLSGASDISAYDLLTKRFNLSSSGAGKASINVSEKLDVEISGAATVYYKGNPEVTTDISGVGVVNKVK